jgi:hypothetical protein
LQIELISIDRDAGEMAAKLETWFLARLPFRPFVQIE